MIIDCHTHLGRNENIKARVSELLKSMDVAHIDKAFVFAGQVGALSNEDMLEEISPYPDRLMGVAAAHPLDPKFTKMSQVQDDAVKLAGWYAEGKIKAVKFYTGYDHYYPFDMKDNDDYLMELEDVGCPAIFHSGDCLNSCGHAKLKYAHPIHIDDVAVDYPKMNFIIAHMGYPWHRDAAEVCYKNPNVYSDISGFVYGSFGKDDIGKFGKVLQEFLEIADSSKLLFGTDWPISDQHSYIETLEYLAAIAPTYKMSEVFGPQYLSQNVKKAFKLQ